MTSPSRLRSGRALAATLLATAIAAASSAQAQMPTQFLDRTLFQTAAPQANNTIDFQSGFAPGGGDFPPATGTGSRGDFMAPTATFVTFKSGSNYTQQVIDGRNVGQGDNDVYTSDAINPQFITADITFGVGVLSLGFDFKNTANGPGVGSGVTQFFTFTLFSGSTTLGSFNAGTVGNGSAFQFLGFTSTAPITEMTIIATVPGATPNLDIVLDNFAVASPVPEPGTVALVGLGLLGLLGGRRALRLRR